MKTSYEMENEVILECTGIYQFLKEKEFSISLKRVQHRRNPVFFHKERLDSSSDSQTETHDSLSKLDFETMIIN